MKEISIFIRTDDLAQVTEILRKHNVGGISFYEINGAGRTKRDAIPEMVRSYMTGRTIVPEYARRTKVETIVSDSVMNQIVEDAAQILMVVTLDVIMRNARRLQRLADDILDVTKIESESLNLKEFFNLN